jgi:3'(2'), 5'-bisphosphate nucleotidase
MMKNKIPFSNPLPETNLAINSVIDAGKTVMKIYNQPFETKIKSDNSPITEADIASNKIIQKIISTSDYPILSEETKDNKKRLEKETVWIIDPLDGTSDFINKTGEFTIMIGLVRKQVPVLGIIYCPPQNTLYVAQQNQGSYQLAGEKWSKMSVSTISDLTKSRTVYSRHHSEENERLFFKYIKTKKLTKRGSSLKAIDVASGTSELYFTSTNKIKQWDTCASYCLVKEAGGNMTDVYGNDLNYNIDDVNHQNGIIVSNGLVHEKVVNSYKRFLKS